MSKRKTRNVLFVAVCGLELVPGFTLRTQAAVIPVVVNEVYAGGGNAGASFTNDFVELFNSGTGSQSLNGLRVDYFTSSGTTASNLVTFGAADSIAPGQHMLITGSGGTTGANFTATVNFTSSVNLANAGGSIRLWDQTNSTDLVGWGTSISSEGTAAATLTNTTSIQRLPDGKDTGANSTDLVSFGPTPGAVNVPEPASIGLLGFAAMAALSRRRRVNQDQQIAQVD